MPEGSSVHELVGVAPVLAHRMLPWPALGQYALESRRDEHLVLLFEPRDELENRLPCAVDQASAFAERQRLVRLNQVRRQVDDHSQPAHAAPFS